MGIKINYNSELLGIRSRTLLFPYFMVLKIRNLLYDRNVIKSVRFSVPVVCVGNITAGGTGKTPHVEMLLRLLSVKYRIAVVSRGYKRKSKGFRLVEVSDSYRDVGDEPLQIKRKFPDVTVAVCKNRISAINRILWDDPSVNLIILDDGFQYRKIRPSHSILLVDYNRPVCGDDLLPAGSLRDLPSQIARAESIIISKAPVMGLFEGIPDESLLDKDLSAAESEWRRKLLVKESQDLYFSNISYSDPAPVFSDVCDMRYIYSGSAIFFSGIADDSEFAGHIGDGYKILDCIKFSDHRDYVKSDMNKLNRWAADYPVSAVFTTEKDSVRIMNNSYVSEDLKRRLFYIPIETNIQKASGNKKLTDRIFDKRGSNEK
ncbi:MAG: tetraacyldisaccharide 4'-kinase [Bacteroidales bacterium]|jgi:tetraacyldisaccharide 4'-kinase|nr:tetraacyldisaccharide 4'-kinase [Bacteroidales bacterium]